ncbi:hypothetical protein PHYPSEUDO_000760 [Phytophthora pseudosyringae]|uniref:Condensation domain-containing protein n=1 Tax=Phytophthora pseudosyringae TaxID=221518 RepID=A0A8T1WE12_9STRA|nr:hypothetical protein PHYPSEUDO_000760 [Phytophthora pseudosyringae]
MSCIAATGAHSSNPRIALRSIERFGIAVDDVAVKCAHVFRISGDIDQLLQFLPTAVMRAFNRHPRLRALVVKDAEFTAEIQPQISLDDVAAKRLLRVRELFDSDEDVAAWTNWGAFVQEETHVPFDRFSQFMFYLTVWVNKADSSARFFLFSDHIVSDGDSGMVVVNDILEDVALLSIEADKPVKELPLRPSLYEMWFAKPLWLKPVAKTIVALFGRAGFLEATKSFKPVLPPRGDQQDFTVPLVRNSTSGLFAEGDPSNMRSALGRCKDERVTFGGALIPIVLLAFYNARKATSSSKGDEEPFKLAADMCFNMRQRVPEPAQERQVGLYVAVTTLQWLMKEGVDMRSTKFWDLARQAKQQVCSQSQNLLEMALPLFMMDRKLNPKELGSFLKDHRVANSVTGDATISNIGRYIYKHKHILAANGELQVESLHTFAAVPFVATTSTLWVASLKAFNYSIAHKTEESIGKELFEAYVTLCENLSCVGSDDTMLDVLKRLKL